MNVTDIIAGRGLYDPAFEHDACGIGAVVNISGRRDHSIVRYGQQVLMNLVHRGAAGSDELTGDGAGILIQIPHAFLAAEANCRGFDLPEPGRYGVALVFTPKDPELHNACHATLDAAASHYGLRLIGRREVPANPDCLGEAARSAEPAICQVFFDGRGLEAEALERRLYAARKRAERLARQRFGESASDFYVCSMSCRTLIYKGMFLAPQLFAYYPDLADERVVTALAVVHQRYSTNTFPNWRLAQPLRVIAHNGEINTLKGNANWMRARERSMACPELGDDLEDLFPVLQPGGSDSACFDNAVELLVRAGRSLPHAMMMMI
ncbi:MAG: glutamate synthase subunit alpha, partial [Phycisphaerae bacterium]|nr:glutamate synthase subunit alpha [Phycisphaerae bacterium]